MPTLQIRELPEDVYNWLKNRAKLNRRSMTKEATMVLEDFSRADKDLNNSTKKLLLSQLDSLPKLDKATASNATTWIRKDRDSK